jgi:hypothetical protein
VTIVETRAITGGVDTHAEVHVAAALDPVGGLLGVAEFPASPAGYAQLLGWLRGFGTVCLVGIEGTGSYGAGLARHITAAGVRVVEVDRADRQDRRRQGKSDPLDAVSAARAAQSGRARGAPKGRDGQVEAIRALMVAKRTARAERVQTINQARALVLTGPDDIRARFAGHATDALVAELAALRPRPGSMVRYHTLVSLHELGKRTRFLGQQLERLGAGAVKSRFSRSPARCPSLSRGGGADPPPARLLQAQITHQPLGGAPGQADTFAVELQPDLVRSVDLPILLPHPGDLGHQLSIARRPRPTAAGSSPTPRCSPRPTAPNRPRPGAPTGAVSRPWRCPAWPRSSGSPHTQLHNRRGARSPGAPRAPGAPSGTASA